MLVALGLNCMDEMPSTGGAIISYSPSWSAMVRNENATLSLLPLWFARVVAYSIHLKEETRDSVCWLAAAIYRGLNSAGGHFNWAATEVDRT